MKKRKNINKFKLPGEQFELEIKKSKLLSINKDKELSFTEIDFLKNEQVIIKKVQFFL